MGKACGDWGGSRGGEGRRRARQRLIEIADPLACGKRRVARRFVWRQLFGFEPNLYDLVWLSVT